MEGQIELETGRNEKPLTEQYCGKLEKEIGGSLFEVVAKIFRGLGNMSLATLMSFRYPCRSVCLPTSSFPYIRRRIPLRPRASHIHPLRGDFFASPIVGWPEWMGEEESTKEGDPPVAQNLSRKQKNGRTTTEVMRDVRNIRAHLYFLGTLRWRRLIFNLGYLPSAFLDDY